MVVNLITEKTERKLEYFANTMQHSIEKKKLIANQTITANHNLVAKSTLESVVRHNKVMLEAKQAELKQKANRQIARAKVNALAQYMKTRNEQIDNLFVDIQGKLARFTQTKEYESYLIRQIKELTAAHSISFAIVILSPHDMRLESSIKTATGLVPKTGSQDFIGGFILLNEARSIQVDCTFKTRLSIAKKGFNYDHS